MSSAMSDKKEKEWLRPAVNNGALWAHIALLFAHTQNIYIVKVYIFLPNSDKAPLSIALSDTGQSQVIGQSGHMFFEQRISLVKIYNLYTAHMSIYTNVCI